MSIIEEYFKTHKIDKLDLWSHWDTARLKAKYREIGDKAYRRGYRQEAFTDEDKTFSFFWKAKKPGIGLDIINPEWPCYTGVDISSPIRPGNVIFTIALDLNNRRYPKEIKCGNWKSPQLIAEIRQTAYQHNSQIVFVENNATQQMVIDWCLELDISLPVKGFLTGKQKADPLVGLPSLDVEFQNDAWCIPMDVVKGHEVDCKCAWCRWFKEMELHPQYPTTDTVMACFTGDVQVLTQRGYIPINMVEMGDMVLTHKSRWRKVTGLTAREYRGEIVKLKVGGFKELNVTPEHNFYSSHAWFERQHRTNRLIPQKWDWTPISDIQVGRKAKGDFLFVPIAPFPQKMIPTIDWSKFVNIDMKPRGSRWEITDRLVAYQSRILMPRMWNLDKEAGILIGLYLAEGHIVDKHQVSFALNKKEKELIDFIDSYSKQYFNVNSTTWDSKISNCICVVLNSVALARLFQRFGKKAYKGLPWEWMGLPLDFRLGIVRGWFLGDGHIYQSRLHGVSISPILIEQIRYTLLEAGYMPTVSFFKQQKGFHAQKLTLNQSDTAKFLNKLTEVEREHWKKDIKQERARTNNSMLKIDNGYAVRITSKCSELYKGLVYNLHVEEDESYVVQGVAVHNCWFSREAARQGMSFVYEQEPEIEGDFIFGE